MISPANTNHRAVPLRVVPRPGEATSSPSPQDFYSASERQEWRRVIVLCVVLFWFIIGVLWWAA